MNLQRGRQRIGDVSFSGIGLRVGLGAITLLCLLSPSHAMPESTPTHSIRRGNCALFSEPQQFNNQTSGDTILIGHQPGRPYRVVFPQAEASAIQEIQACVLDAFATRSSAGEYLQIGSFERRRDAEALNRILRRAGYATRVVYSR